MVEAHSLPVTLQSPIIIGCTGGSGSRLVQQIVETAGNFMGARLNHSRDAMDFEPFLDEVINLVLEQTRSLYYTVDDIEPRLRSYCLTRLHEIITRYASDRTSECKGWGWKNPRSMYILPFIRTLCPNLRFVHLVRDGRYMAVSNNQNQLHKHYQSLVGDILFDNAVCKSIDLWNRANLAVSDLCQHYLSRQHLCTTYEALCSKPHEAIEQIAGFLGQEWDTEMLSGLIINKANAQEDMVGSMDQELLSNLENIASAGLSYYGYKNAAI